MYMNVLEHSRLSHPGTASELFDETCAISANALRTGAVVLSGIADGALDYGKGRAKNHLPELLLDIGLGFGLGAAAVAGLALSPVWARAAITGIGLVGTAIIAKGVGSGLYDAAPAIAAAWRSPQNDTHARQVVGRNVGPIVFDLAVATVSGIAGGVASAGLVGRAVPNYYAARAITGSSTRILTAHEAASAGSNTTYISNIQAEVSTLIRPRPIDGLKFSNTYKASSMEPAQKHSQT